MLTTILRSAVVVPSPRDVTPPLCLESRTLAGRTRNSRLSTKRLSIERDPRTSSFPPSLCASDPLVRKRTSKVRSVYGWEQINGRCMEQLTSFQPTFWFLETAESRSPPLELIIGFAIMPRLVFESVLIHPNKGPSMLRSLNPIQLLVESPRAGPQGQGRHRGHFISIPNDGEVERSTDIFAEPSSNSWTPDRLQSLFLRHIGWVHSIDGLFESSIAIIVESIAPFWPRTQSGRGSYQG